MPVIIVLQVRLFINWENVHSIFFRVEDTARIGNSLKKKTLIRPSNILYSLY